MVEAGADHGRHAPIQPADQSCSQLAGHRYNGGAALVGVERFEVGDIIRPYPTVAEIGCHPGTGTDQVVR
ncbi:hypothetical protein [Micromonospora sp. ATCC 39149]|uniref:Uncharacterized protein n=1 Tax=Micromonospora carbonacea TaxID=47853 RepID=A0A7D6CG12_9ACTN|nr:hypothetical protein [Micromonospora sp. ATCC 39149]QLK00552.1 hypothetical protein HZU44_11295 [Micromonospora carbonacea]